MMRITNRYLANNILYGIQNNIGKLARSQEQIATSKRILRPSDDPNVMGQFMAIKASLSYNLQYDRNLDDALSYLNMNDAAMDTIGEVLSQAGELITQAAHDTYSPSDRAAIAEQIDKMIDQVVDLGNATVGGKYIYGGTKNSKPPFTREGDAIFYHGDTNGVYREVLTGTPYRIDAPGVTTGVQVAAINDAAKGMQPLPQVTQRPTDREGVGIIKLGYDGGTINVIGQTNLNGSYKGSLVGGHSFGPDDDSDSGGFVFEVTDGDLKGLKIEFSSNMEDGAEYSFTIDNRLGVFGNADLDNSVVYDPDASPKDDVDKGIFDALFTLRDRLNNNDTATQESITELQEKIDQLLQHRVQVARTRHFESIKMQLLDQEVKLTESLDKIEGADMARLSIEVSQQSLTYMASLAIGAQILQTSLLDFLR
ncbi:MAG: flagellar hook-associated protein FlgL [Candidatus Syntrophopropionicum ammoniitolerans]